MHRLLCQCVLLVALGGCFLSHGDDDPVPRPRVDGGSGSPDAIVPMPGRDAGPPPGRDASTPVPPPDCWTATTPVRAGRACVPNEWGAVPPSSNYSLDLYLDGCFCDESLSCTSFVADPGVLMLETRMCPGRADCDGCVSPLRVSCPIPPLDAGQWQVVVNGARAFDLTVAPPTPGLGPVQQCYDFAPEADAAVTCEWPGAWSATGTETCHPPEAFVGEPTLARIADTCASCFAGPGQCAVTVVGDTITLSPYELSCDCPTCGACPDICIRLERTCTIPPLAAGTYRVVSPAGATELVVGDRVTAPADICVGSIGGG